MPVWSVTGPLLTDVLVTVCCGVNDHSLSVTVWLSVTGPLLTDVLVRVCCGVYYHSLSYMLHAELAVSSSLNGSELPQKQHTNEHNKTPFISA